MKEYAAIIVLSVIFSYLLFVYITAINYVPQYKTKNNKLKRKKGVQFQKNKKNKKR